MSAGRNKNSRSPMRIKQRKVARIRKKLRQQKLRTLRKQRREYAAKLRAMN